MKNANYKPTNYKFYRRWNVNDDGSLSAEPTEFCLETDFDYENYLGDFTDTIRCDSREDALEYLNSDSSMTVFYRIHDFVFLSMNDEDEVCESKETVWSYDVMYDEENKCYIYVDESGEYVDDLPYSYSPEDMNEI